MKTKIVFGLLTFLLVVFIILLFIPSNGSLKVITSPKIFSLLKSSNHEFIEIELLVIGFNSNQSFFVKYDSISSEGGLINPDTLKQLYGGFKVETVLRNKKNPIRVDMNINSPYGKSKKGRLYDEIIID